MKKEVGVIKKGGRDLDAEPELDGEGDAVMGDTPANVNDMSHSSSASSGSSSSTALYNVDEDDNTGAVRNPFLWQRRVGVVSNYAPNTLRNLNAQKDVNTGQTMNALALPNGTIVSQNYRGVLTKMIHEIVQTRIMLKKSLKLLKKAGKCTP